MLAVLVKQTKGCRWVCLCVWFCSCTCIYLYIEVTHS